MYCRKDDIKTVPCAASCSLNGVLFIFEKKVSLHGYVVRTYSKHGPTSPMPLCVGRFSTILNNPPDTIATRYCSRCMFQFGKSTLIWSWHHMMTCEAEPCRYSIRYREMNGLLYYRDSISSNIWCHGDLLKI